MLLPIAHRLRVELKHDPNLLYNLITTMLDERDVSWREVAEAYSFTTSGYVALLLLDDSDASKAFRRIASQRYEDLDRITGDDLLVLSVIAPPPRWANQCAQRLRGLPLWARELQQRELVLVQTPRGEEQAAANMRDVIREHFERDTPLPAVCVLCFAPDPAGGTNIDAIAIDIAPYDTEKAIVDVFEQLSRTARKARLDGATAREMAEQATALFNPVSLRWRRALLKFGGFKQLIERLVGAVTK